MGLPAGIRACLFDLDGVLTPTAAVHAAAWKPATDSYLHAARLLGVDAASAAVSDDAPAGVEAGRAGGFGYVVGVDRTGQADALRAHGADIVVKDLAELLDQPDQEVGR